MRTAQLTNAIRRLANLCPFYNDLYNSYDRQKWNSVIDSINELNAAYDEYTDEIERKAIKLFRNFQDEQIDQLESVCTFEEGYNTKKLKSKYRKIEDHLHGFISRNTAGKLKLANNTFSSILESRNTNTAYSRLNGYIDSLLERNISKMATYLKNRLPGQIEEINSEFFKKNFDSDINKKHKKETKNQFYKQENRLLYAKAKDQKNLLAVQAKYTIIFIYFLNDY